jgi:hypothetical protein
MGSACGACTARHLGEGLLDGCEALAHLVLAEQCPPVLADQ